MRALSPHIGAYVQLPGGERLIVWRARAVGGEVAGDVSPAGLVVDGERLALACAGGVLELLDVQPAGGRAMDAAAYVRGRRSPRSSPARA